MSNHDKAYEMFSFQPFFWPSKDIVDGYKVCCFVMFLFKGALNTLAAGFDWLLKCALNT